MLSEQKKAAAAEVTRNGMNNSKCEAGGDCGIYGVAAGTKYLESSIGSKMMHAHHHPVLRANRLLAAPGKDVA